MAKSTKPTTQSIADDDLSTKPSHYHKMLALFGGLTLLFLSAAALTLWADSVPPTDADRALHRRPSALRDIPEFINLTISETGIAAITTEDLRPFNWQLSTFSHETMNLTRQGEPIPYFIDDDGQTMFFLAEAITTSLMAPAVYQLSLGAGLPMSEREAAGTGRGSNRGTFRAVWEENSNFLAQTGSSDPWLGRLLLAPNAWDFSLTGIQPSGGRGRLILSVWSSTASFSNPDHHLQVALNGRQLEDWVWDGIRYTTTTVDLPRGLLQPDGRNVLNLTSPGDISASGEAIYVDRIELLYEGVLQAGQGQFWFSSTASTLTIQNADENFLLFDVSNRQQPVILTNATQAGPDLLFAAGGNARYYGLNRDEAIRPSFSNGLIAKQALRQAERGADYIVIYPNDANFAAALQPLLAYRASQGLRVTAVPLEQIFAEFGYGQQDASAIRAFLSYAQANWQPPPPALCCWLATPATTSQQPLWQKIKTCCRPNWCAWPPATPAATPGMR
ncbi:MAG: C25 family cysteine peptidase [Chloroflexota bacterium]